MLYISNLDLLKSLARWLLKAFAPAVVRLFLPIMISLQSSLVQASDLGELLRPDNVRPSEPKRAGHGKGLLRNIAIRAGQTVLIQTGYTAIAGATLSKATASIATLPNCGEVKTGPDGILYNAGKECLGEKVDFSYVVSVRTAAGLEKLPVNVRLAISSGLKTCGLENSPYQFLKVEGGEFIARKAPSAISDLIALLPSASFRIESFCIMEEAVPRAEFLFTLQGISRKQKRKFIPEALKGLVNPAAPILTGQSLRQLASGVSWRTAHFYAQQKSHLLSRKLQLPDLQHYIAAAWRQYENQDRNNSSQKANSFLVSLRSGLLEWTRVKCKQANEDTYVAVGPERNGTKLTQFCFEQSRRGFRMGFRLIAPVKNM